MQSTARDFWKIACDRKCGVLVMLCDLVETGKVGGYTAVLLWCSWHVCVYVCAGDMPPVLAVQWHPHSWRVHCGTDPGRKALWILY